MIRTRTYRVVPLLGLALLAACPESGNDIIEPGDPLEITTNALPLGSIGDAYSAGIDAEGGNGEYHWDLSSGELPPGLALSVEDLTDDDVVITGIPEVAGSFSFVLRVESDDDQSETRAFTLVVLEEAAPIAIVTPALPPALVGAQYSTDLDAVVNEGSSAFTFTIESGALPTGLTLDADGTLLGVATVADTTAVIIGVSNGTVSTTRTFTLQAVANRTGSYDITVVPVVPIPPAIQPAVDAAIDRLEAAITGDLSAITIDPGTLEGGDCGGFGPVANGTTADDLILLVNIAPIDGPNEVLGFAGPCLIRNSNGLPLLGILTLDVVDLSLLSTGNQIALVTHETGHVLGFGSMWESGGFDLVTSSTSDPRFTGAAAVNQWQGLGGAGNVPVEEEGGQGTARSHWNEETFGAELMTGFANTSVFQPLSRMSIASFADMGYAVNLNAADAYSLPPQSPAAVSPAGALAGYDVALDLVVGAVDENGNVTAIRRGDR